jgi:ribosomal protein L16 Arg81 hydroxylase
VYLDEPDLERFPLLRQTTPYKVVLRPGDVLYIPSFWHHEVRSLPDAAEKLNMAVNFWYKAIRDFPEEKELFSPQPGPPSIAEGEL